jgi:hypothetical protein
MVGDLSKGVASTEPGRMCARVCHEFMHEHEHGNNACHLGLLRDGAVIVEVTEKSVETSRCGVETLI